MTTVPVLRFVSPGSPNDGMLVQSLGLPGYDPSTDTLRDDWATIILLEDAKNARAGTKSACHVSKLKRLDGSDI